MTLRLAPMQTLFSEGPLRSRGGRHPCHCSNVYVLRQLVPTLPEDCNLIFSLYAHYGVVDVERGTLKLVDSQQTETAARSDICWCLIHLS